MKSESISSLIDLFLPRLCPGCGQHMSRGEDGLCVKCLANLPETYFYLKKENPVYYKFTGRFDFYQAAACYYFHKSSVMQNIIHHFKYKNGRDTAHFMGKQMGNLLKNTSFEYPDAFIPVPLHPRKKRKRGYNQSELLAQGISSQLDIPVCSDVLLRRIHTQTQTKLNAVQRWENVKNAFSLSGHYQLKGQHLLLIDDVVTSGATLEACARRLSQLEEIKVSMLTLAIADY